MVRDGRPVRSFDDAQYYIRYLDNSIRWIKERARFASPSDRQASIDAFERGRAIYAQRASEAGQSSS